MIDKKTVSIIIPTLNAEKSIFSLIETLNEQTVELSEIVIVDSESEDNTVEICNRFGNVRVIQILRKDFDHGGTRDMAVKTCSTDLVLFMTQDAVPNNKYYIENLIKPFSDPEVAMVSGRQIARSDAYPMEKLVREFNYPAQSHVRSKADINKYGIKTYYVSNACSAYRRDIYEKIGGFEHNIKTNEDMFFAAHIINNNYKIAYAADAEVIHSHNFTLKEQYKRNYIIGMEMERHKELLGNVSADSEGIRLVKYVSAKLLKRGMIFQLIRFIADCCARKLGNAMGKRCINKHRP